MSPESLDREDVARKAEALYNECIRARVEPQLNGKIVAIDVDSGEYEIDDSILPATHKLKARRPDGRFFARRIGSDAVYTFGPQLLSAKR